MQQEEPVSGLLSSPLLPRLITGNAKLDEMMLLLFFIFFDRL